MADVKHTHGCCADKACSDKTCMELPAGTTCGDCRNFRHCEAFYAHKATDTYCDFFPRRFVVAKPVGAARATEGGATDAAECTCAAKDMPFGRCCKAGAA